MGCFTQDYCRAVDTPLSTLVNPAFFRRPDDAAGEPVVLDGVARALSMGTIALLEKINSSGKSLSDFIGKEALGSQVGKTVDILYPELVAGIMKTLGDKDVVAMMEKTGSQIMRKAIDRMNAVQRFFIGLGQYDRAILESMPATLADFRASVRDSLSSPATRATIVDRARSVAALVSGKPLSSFGMFPDPVNRDAAIASLSEAIRKMLSTIGFESLSDLVQTLVSNGTVGDVIRVFPELKDKVGLWLADWSSNLLKMNEGEQSAGKKAGTVFLGTFWQEFALQSSSVPLGETVTVDDESLSIIAGAVAEGLSSLAAAESPTMLDSIDIRSLVVDKIDSFG